MAYKMVRGSLVLNCVLLLVCAQTAKAQRSTTQFQPYIGVVPYESGSSLNRGLFIAGIQFSVRLGSLELTVLNLSAPIISRSFVRIDTGINAFPAAKKYVGAGIGVARFSSNYAYVAARAGALRPLFGKEVRLEGRWEYDPKGPDSARTAYCFC